MSWWSNIKDAASYLNPVTLVTDAVDYVWGNGDAVDTATDTLEDSKTYWDDTKTDNTALLDGYITKASANKTANQNVLSDYSNTLESMYGDSASKYSDLMKKYENMGGYQAGTFDYSKSANDFLSPAMNMRIKAAQNAITNSQANAGNMFSSDYLAALDAKSQAIASEEYDKAYDRMMQDRASTLNEWTAQNAENKAAYDSESDIYKNLINLYGNDRTSYMSGLGNYYNQLMGTNNDYMNQYGDYIGQLINNSNAYTQGLTNIDTSKAGAEMAEDNGWANALNFGMNAFNSMMAG